MVRFVWKSEIGNRGSTCESVLKVGAGAPGGVRLPWARQSCRRVSVEKQTTMRVNARDKFIGVAIGVVAFCSMKRAENQTVSREVSHKRAPWAAAVKRRSGLKGRIGRAKRD
jgi:hypothetical protein